MNATVVEFNALTDTDGTAADGDKSLLGACLHVGQQVNAGGAVGLVGGIVVRRLGCKFGSTGIDHAVDRVEFQLMASLHHGTFVLTGGQRFEALRREACQRIGDVGVAEPVALPASQFLGCQLGW